MALSIHPHRLTGKNIFIVMCNSCEKRHVLKAEDFGLPAEIRLYGEIDDTRRIGWTTKTGNRDERNNFILEDVKHYCPECSEKKVYA